MKKLISVFGLVLIQISILVNTVFAGANHAGTIDTGAPVRQALPVPSYLPDPPERQENIDAATVTLINTWTPLQVCFPIPSGWVNLQIRVWHPAAQSWNELLMVSENINGINHLCADVDVNGTIALQGQNIEKLVDVEKTPCQRDPKNCPVLGCTDPKATNYDASADTDDGSCIYIKPE